MRSRRGPLGAFRHLNSRFEKYLERQQHYRCVSLEQGIEPSTGCNIWINREECHRDYCHRDEDDEGSLLNPCIQDSGKGADRHAGDERFIRNLDVGTSSVVSEITALPPSGTSNYTAPAVLRGVETHPIYDISRNNNGVRNLSDNSALSWPTRPPPRILHRSFGRASDIQSDILWANSEQQRSSSLQTDLDSALVFSLPAERASSVAIDYYIHFGKILILYLNSALITI
ncbi:hypothetical protein GGR58DRAFT_506014 [Xylaria digitata]|nr:hypothetical protein GGR58DRAFT_506014 [Xylaria digitata]